MELHFTDEEKLRALKFLGYTVKDVEKTEYISVYHNQIEERDFTVKQIYDQNGKEIPFHHYAGAGNHSMRQVDEIFKNELEKFILSKFTHNTVTRKLPWQS